jgi:hypothetical protein
MCELLPKEWLDILKEKKDVPQPSRSQSALNFH